MTVAPRRTREAELQHLLRQVAAETVVVTASYCVALNPGVPTTSENVARLEEALAWIAARVTDRAWDLLSADAADARAPIAWAVQEIIEWAEHLVRFEIAGDRECRVPLTWLPCGGHPLGTRDVATAVEERMDLLREELYDHGVSIATLQDTEVAA